MDLTLFEIHLDDATFSTNAPFSGTGEREPTAEVGATGAEPEEAGDDDVGSGERGRSAGRALGLAVALALAGVLLWGLRRRRSDADATGEVVEVEP
ncbi:MAG: hypothetical protein ABEJ30_05450 [Halorientalis sp.]